MISDFGGYTNGTLAVSDRQRVRGVMVVVGPIGGVGLFNQLQNLFGRRFRQKTDLEGRFQKDEAE